MKCFRKIAAAALAVTLLFCLTGCKDKEEDYAAAKELFLAEKYLRARSAFKELDNYKDSVDFIKECDYRMALAHFEEGDFETAAITFRAMGKYKESQNIAQFCDYMIARDLYDSGDYENAIKELSSMGNYRNSAELAQNASDILLARQLAGKWEYSVDLTDTIQALVLEAASAQFGDDYADLITLGEYSLQKELEISEDGFWSLKLKATGSRKMIQDIRKAMQTALIAYNDKKIEKDAEELEIDVADWLDSNGVTTNEEMFQINEGITMDACIEKMFPEAALEALFSDSGSIGYISVENGEIHIFTNGVTLAAEFNQEEDTFTLTANPDNEEEAVSNVFTRK